MAAVIGSGSVRDLFSNKNPTNQAQTMTDQIRRSQEKQTKQVGDIGKSITNSNSKILGHMKKQAEFNPNDPRNRQKALTRAERANIKTPGLIELSHKIAERQYRIADNSHRHAKTWKKEQLRILTEHTGILREIAAANDNRSGGLSPLGALVAGLLIPKAIGAVKNLIKFITSVPGTLLKLGRSFISKISKGISSVYKSVKAGFVAVGKGFSGVIKFIAGKIPNSIKVPFLNFFKKVGGFFDDAYKAIKTRIPKFIKVPALGFYNKLVAFLAPVRTFFSGMRGAFSAGGIFSRISSAFAPIAKLFAPLRTALAGGARFLGKIFWPITAILGVIDAFKGWNNAEEILGLKEGEEATLINKISAAMGSVVNGLLLGIPDWLANKFGFENISRMINTGIEYVIGDPVAALTDLATFPIRYLAKGIEYLGSLIPTWDEIKYNWLGIEPGGWIDKAADVITAPFRYIGKTISYIWDNIPKWNDIKNYILGDSDGSIMDKVINLVTTPYRMVKDLVFWVGGKIADAASSIYDYLPDIGLTKLFTDISDTITEFVYEIKGVINSLVWKAQREATLLLITDEEARKRTRIAENLVGRSKLEQEVYILEVMRHYNSTREEAINTIIETSIGSNADFGIVSRLKESLEQPLNQSINSLAARLSSVKVNELNSTTDDFFRNARTDLENRDAESLNQRIDNYMKTTGVRDRNLAIREIGTYFNQEGLGNRYYRLLGLSDSDIDSFSPQTTNQLQDVANRIENTSQSVVEHIDQRTPGWEQMTSWFNIKTRIEDIYRETKEAVSPSIERLKESRDKIWEWMSNNIPQWEDIADWFDLPINHPLRTGGPQNLNNFMNSGISVNLTMSGTGSGSRTINSGNTSGNSISFSQGSGQAGSSSAISGLEGTNINMEALSNQEGFRQTSYTLPQFPASGVTIATGVDLGSKTIEDLRQSGISNSAITSLTPFLGLKGQAAVSAHNRIGPVTLSSEDARKLDVWAKSDVIGAFITGFNRDSRTKFQDLPSGIQTVLALRAYNWGSYFGTHGSQPRKQFYQYCIRGQWEQAGNYLKNMRGRGGLGRAYRQQGQMILDAIRSSNNTTTERTDQDSPNVGSISSNNTTPTPRSSGGLFSGIGNSISSYISPSTNDNEPIQSGSGVGITSSGISTGTATASNTGSSTTPSIPNPSSAGFEVSGSYFTGPDNFRSSAGYTWRDFKNSGQYGGPGRIDPKIIAVLDYISAKTGRKYSITSAFRSQAYNDELRRRGGGAARNSLHIQGKALDVNMSGLSSDQRAAFVEAAGEAGVGGVGNYRNFIHIDSGRPRTWGNRPNWFHEALNKGRGNAGQNSSIPANSVSETGEAGNNQGSQTNSISSTSIDTATASTGGGASGLEARNSLISSLNAFRSSGPSYQDFENSLVGSLGGGSSINNSISSSAQGVRPRTRFQQIATPSPIPMNNGAINNPVQTGMTQPVVDNPVPHMPFRNSPNNPVGQEISKGQPRLTDIPIMIDEMGVVIFNSRLLG